MSSQSKMTDGLVARARVPTSIAYHGAGVRTHGMMTTPMRRSVRDVGAAHVVPFERAEETRTRGGEVLRIFVREIFASPQPDRTTEGEPAAREARRRPPSQRCAISTRGTSPARRPRHHAVRPPSRTRHAPVMYDDASEHRNTIASPYSSSFAIRPSGIRSETRSYERRILVPGDAADAQRVGSYSSIGPVGREVARQPDDAGLDHGVGHGLHRLQLLRDAIDAVEALIRSDQAQIRRDVDDRRLTVVRPWTARRPGRTGRHR